MNSENLLAFIYLGGSILFGTVLCVIVSYNAGMRNGNLDAMDRMLSFGVGFIWPVLLLILVVYAPIWCISSLAHRLGKCSYWSRQEPVGSHPTARRIE